MKIFSSEQLKKADKITEKSQGISSLELMERAANLAFMEIQKLLEAGDSRNLQRPEIKVFCGVGNNGGDGLVIARLLLEQNHNAKAYVVNYSDKRSPGFLENYQRLKSISKEWPGQIKSENDFPEILENDLVIDAIFGIGLNRPLEDWVGKLAKHINASNAFVASIDMPSGLFSERVPKKNEVVVNSNLTLTFQCPKLVFFLPQTAGFVGDFRIIDIGLDKEFLQKAEPLAQLVGKNEARPLYRGRKRFSHKGTYGHVLVVGGSYGKMGSVVLASTAAFKAGCGKVTVLIPKCGYEILQTALPEAMALVAENEKHLIETKVDLEPETICFGIGAGKHPETVKAFEKILKATKRPMIIDADGLNIMSENPGLQKSIPKGSILAPHPKELEGLVGKWKDDFDKIEKAKAFSKKHQVVMLIKGAYTLVIAEQKLYVNTTGNPGMATAGSGDVLAGILAGLLAQGYDSATAAVFGVYLHGKAGDFAAKKSGFESLLAGDISKYLGEAFLDLMRELK